MLKKYYFIFTVLLFYVSNLNAQFDYNPNKHCYVYKGTDECIPNTIVSSLPFLRIIPDARGASLGDAGIAISPDAASIHFNAAKIAMSEKDFEISTTYTPWLKNLGLNDIYLAYISGYNKFSNIQGIGYSIRFFSLGEIAYTNEQGRAAGFGNPSEFEIAAAYSRKLSNNLSAALTGKFIYSNLAEGQTVDGISIYAATAFAADLSLFYKTKFDLGGYKSTLNTGMSVSNIGSPVSYSKGTDKDFLPQNLGIGVALEMAFDDYNTMTITTDFNKLLLPTPIIENDSVVRYEGSPISAMFESFSDAQGGFTEEMREITFSIGLEYWYDKQFAVRAGYFYEHPLKGDRQFLTLGFGLNYNVYGMGISYLVPTNNTRNPLDGTLRFTFSLDLTPEKFEG